MVWRSSMTRGFVSWRMDRTLEKGAPMSCAMVFRGEDDNRFQSVFLKFGTVVCLPHLRDKDVGAHEHVTDDEANVGDHFSQRCGMDEQKGAQ